jgi:predicted transcriptional regulator
MAADILMPWHLLRPILDRGESDIASLAERFKVSRDAMAIRLGVPQSNA